MWIRRTVQGVALASLALTARAIIAQSQGAANGLAAQASGVGLKVAARPYDTAKLAAPHGLSDTVYRGRVIWMQRCAYCHDGVGQPSYNTKGPFLDPEVITPMGDAGIRLFITQGTENMPSFEYALSTQQIDDVIAYVKTIPASAKPTEDQLAGRLPGGAPLGAQGTPSAPSAPVVQGGGD